MSRDTQHRAQHRAWRRSGGSERHEAERSPDDDSPWAVKTRHIRDQLGTGVIFALVGPRGTGKTQMAVETMRYEVRNYHPSVLIVRAMDVFIDIREAYDSPEVTERDQIKRFIAPHLLVIDEASERSDSEWENRMFTYVIDQRYAAMTDTILISNQTPKDFEQSIGSSIYSRITEAGGIVQCDWPSFRGAKQ